MCCLISVPKETIALDNCAISHQEAVLGINTLPGICICVPNVQLRRKQDTKHPQSTSGRPEQQCAWVRAPLDGKANGNRPSPASSHTSPNRLDALWRIVHRHGPPRVPSLSNACRNTTQTNTKNYTTLRESEKATQLKQSAINTDPPDLVLGSEMDGCSQTAETFPTTRARAGVTSSGGREHETHQKTARVELESCSPPKVLSCKIKPASLSQRAAWLQRRCILQQQHMHKAHYHTHNGDKEAFGRW